MRQWKSLFKVTDSDHIILSNPQDFHLESEMVLLT